MIRQFLNKISYVLVMVMTMNSLVVGNVGEGSNINVFDQSRLSAIIKDKSGKPIQGRYDIVLYIKKENSDGTQTSLWQKKYDSHPFENGLVSLPFGENIPNSIYANQNLKVGILIDIPAGLTAKNAVEQEEDLLKAEIDFIVVPKARFAEEAGKVNWSNVADKPSIGSLSGTINATQIPDNFITDSKIVTINASKITGIRIKSSDLIDESIENKHLSPGTYDNINGLGTLLNLVVDGDVTVNGKINAKIDFQDITNKPNLAFNCAFIS